MGPINASALDFISNLGQKISYLSDDDKEAQLLLQRTSVTIKSPIVAVRAAAAATRGQCLALSKAR